MSMSPGDRYFTDDPRLPHTAAPAPTAPELLIFLINELSMPGYDITWMSLSGIHTLYANKAPRHHTPR